MVSIGKDGTSRPDKSAGVHFWNNATTHHWHFQDGVWHFATWPSYGGGGEGTTEKRTTIPLWPRPRAKGTVSCEEMRCELDGTTSTAHESTSLSSYQWIFRDTDGVETTKNGSVISHTFPDEKAGISHEIHLKVTDATGQPEHPDNRALAVGILSFPQARQP